ncbi:MAG TPA: glutamate-5-semialdehyde dehydrogenase [Synechococcales bacterium UBA10510]|nr:glutamate-5-semialdehyde dehydrogenase [Synechococcales bacterium UBA10510]
MSSAAAGMAPVPEPSPELLQRAAGVRRSAMALGQWSDAERRAAVQAMASALESDRHKILAANQADMETAAADGLTPALMARLKLDGAKLDAAISGVRQVAALADPLGRRQLHTELDQGLVLERLTVPLGVVGVIFEARPDAAIQIASLAIRSGNGAILKGGREASRSCAAIMAALRQGLAKGIPQTIPAPDPIADDLAVSNTSATKPLANNPLPPIPVAMDSAAGDLMAASALELLTSREESLALLKLDGLVDLIIPRGSNALVRYIQDNTRIPVLGHADGICHLYVDAAADLDQALRVAIDAKTQYPAACNAIETLLVHEQIAPSFLAMAIEAFGAAGVELRGDAAALALGVEHAASEEDWSSEYSDLVLAVKLVADLDAAIEHIGRYGSRHTDAICTTDDQAANRFLAAVDSAGVYLNCSTRFADGFRYGFGAEVGISTQTLPPRGPVGLEGLVTYRYRLRGEGHIAADYASGARQFSHRALPL